MSQDRRFTALAAALLSILPIGACVTSTPMNALAEVQKTPKSTAYPAVEDAPPRPDKPAMTADEQLKLKNELATARDRQAKSKAKGGASRDEPAKP